MMSRNLIFLSISFLSVRIENYRDLQDKDNDSAFFADIIALDNKMINWPLQLQVRRAEFLVTSGNLIGSSRT